MAVLKDSIVNGDLTVSNNVTVSNNLTASSATIGGGANIGKTITSYDNEVSNLSMPEYSSKITFTSGTTYTAPCAGYVFNHTNPQSTHYLTTVVAGITFQEYSYDSNSYNAHTHFIAISKGKTFVTQNTSNVRYFIPTVGAVKSGEWKGSL